MPQTVAERIAEIDAILQAGTTLVRHGDRTVQYDLAELRKERATLLASQATGSNFRRVTFTNV
jgi:hypothetical protein